MVKSTKKGKVKKQILAEASAKPALKPKRPSKPTEATVGSAAGSPEMTLRASRRFWLILLGSGLGLLLLVQGYGYFTGWGNPQRVIDRHFTAAQRLTMAKRYSAAIRQYQKIVDKSQQAEVIRQAVIGMADLYRETHEWSKAIALYQQLRDAEANSVMGAWAGLKIAESHYDAGQSQEALKMYAQIQNDFPNSDWEAEAQLGIGKVYEKQKNYAEAIRSYHALHQKYQGGFLAAEAMTRIGQCYEQQGDSAAARGIYQQILNDYPETMTEEARLRLQRLDHGEEPVGVRQWGE